MLTVSVVSHGHGAMVAHLCGQLLALPELAQLIVTLNIEEPLELPQDARIEVLRNEHPKGFGANHNAAFAHCKTDMYCVVNPDIELPENPFPALLAALEDPSIALAAPVVLGASGGVEDSWRRFPSPFDLLLKALGRHDGTYSDVPSTGRFDPDWVAGMFLLFKAQDYAALGGFDERFFLYYEDVDICARLRTAKRGIAGCTEARIVHKAQRASWQNWRYRRYHLTSITRYFSRGWQRIFPATLRRKAG